MFLEKEAIDFFRQYDFLLPVFSGSHGDIPSRIIGRNMEFEQYNNYFPGDNIRDIDWKVFGRTDKLFVKKYGSDLSSRVRLIVDNSKSMSYLQKFSLTLNVTAIFTYLLHNFRSRVNLATVNDKFQNLGPLTLKQLEQDLEKLDTSDVLDISGIPSENKTISFFLSDLWTSDENIDLLIQRRIHVIHIMHPRERNLDISGNIEFVDLETNRKLEVIPSTIREEYKKRMHERLTGLSQKFRQAGLSYGIIDGSKKYYVQLKEYLGQSLRMPQRRSL